MDAEQTEKSENESSLVADSPRSTRSSRMLTESETSTSQSTSLEKMDTLQWDDIVWAKVKGHMPWPAKIIPPEQAPAALRPKSSRSGAEQMHFVQFFGTLQHSRIATTDMWPFGQFRDKLMPRRATAGFTAALQLADEEYRCKALSLSVAHPAVDQELEQILSSNHVGQLPDVCDLNSSPTIRMTPPARPHGRKRKAEEGPAATNRPTGVENELNGNHCGEVQIRLERRRKLELLQAERKQRTKVTFGEGFDGVRLASKIGVIGTSALVFPPGQCLARSRHEIVVYETDFENYNPVKWEELGVRQEMKMEQVLSSCAYIMTWFENDKLATDLLIGQRPSLVDRLNTGHKVIDFSLLNAAARQRIAAAVREAGAFYLEVQLIATPPGRIALCAGDKFIFEIIQSCLASLSNKAVFLGDSVGGATVLRTLVDFLHVLLATGFSQTLRLADQFGLRDDLDDLLCALPVPQQTLQELLLASFQERTIDQAHRVLADVETLTDSVYQLNPVQISVMRDLFKHLARNNAQRQLADLWTLL